jgi:hypothetical protein
LIVLSSCVVCGCLIVLSSCVICGCLIVLDIGNDMF